MSDRKRKVVGRHSTWYVCDVHGWDFTDEDKDLCPVCMGESLERERIIKLLENAIDHDWKGSEPCEACDQTNYLIALIKGESK